MMKRIAASLLGLLIGSSAWAGPGDGYTPPPGAQLNTYLPQTFSGAVGMKQPINVLSKRFPGVSQDNVRVNPAMSAPAWVASKTYGNGDIVSNGGSDYEEQFGVSCTSAGSGGPSGTGSNIVDNTCIWKLVTNVVAADARMPTITDAMQWAPSTVYKAGANTVTYTGSGATAVGNIYHTVAGGTSASSGGPTGQSPPTDGTITWVYVEAVPTAIFSNASANSYLWNGGAGSIATHAYMWGGTPTDSVSTHYLGMVAATVNNLPSAGPARYAFTTDAQQIVVRSFEQANISPTLNSAWRVIVCQLDGTQCKYVSTNSYGQADSVTVGGWMRTVIDFSATGNREARYIIVESSGNSSFGGIDVSATDSVYLPTVTRPIAMAVTGDSYPAGGGLYWGPELAFPMLVADYLGIQNAINGAIGGCGYLVFCTSGTAFSRIADVTKGNNGQCPDIVLDANGTNDVAGSTPAAIVAAMLQYFQALRTACGPTMPIMQMGIWAHANGGSSYTAGVTAENAMAAAVVGLNDPYIFFIPVLTDPGGAWQTGTGYIGAAVGTATFATNVMTVTAMTSGTWQLGMVVTSSGVTLATTITGGSGLTNGQTGAYSLSTSPGTIGTPQPANGNSQLGNGNGDYALEGQGSPPSGHPNAYGNRAIFATRLLTSIINIINSGNY